MKSNFLLIALTGNIASGKSTVCHFLEKSGVKVIDADQLARKVVLPGSLGLEQIVKKFGSQYLNSKDLDRKKLAELVFNNPIAKQELEQILHPLIRNEFKQQLKELHDYKGIVCYAVPLFFEAKLDRSDFDYLVVIASTMENSISRIIARDKLSQEQAKIRYQSQMPIAEKIKAADFVIYNDAGLTELEQETKKLYESLQAKIATCD